MGLDDIAHTHLTAVSFRFFYPFIPLYLVENLNLFPKYSFIDLVYVFSSEQYHFTGVQVLFCSPGTLSVLML